MTQWVRPGGGRERGPVGLAKAWVALLVQPRRFFRDGIAPGDQAPGLVFAMAVVLVEEASRYALDPTAIPAVLDGRLPSAAFALTVAVLLVTPLVLHLVAAVLVLGQLAIPESRRAGVSETVQVVAYATAPCALAGVPSPGLRALCGLYGAVLLVLGVHARNDVSLPIAAALAVVPAALVFGYAFRAFAAWRALVGG